MNRMDEQFIFPKTIGDLLLADNYGWMQLKDAVWFPYTEGTFATGMNGYVEGTVVDGIRVSRLFHVTQCDRLSPGGAVKVDYIHLKRLRISAEGARYESYTCG